MLTFSDRHKASQDRLHGSRLYHRTHDLPVLRGKEEKECRQAYEPPHVHASDFADLNQRFLVRPLEIRKPGTDGYCNLSRLATSFFTMYPCQVKHAFISPSIEFCCATTYMPMQKKKKTQSLNICNAA